MSLKRFEKPIGKAENVRINKYGQIEFSIVPAKGKGKLVDRLLKAQAEDIIKEFKVPKSIIGKVSKSVGRPREYPILTIPKSCAKEIMDGLGIYKKVGVKGFGVFEVRRLAKRKLYDNHKNKMKSLPARNKLYFKQSDEAEKAVQSI